MNEDPRMIEDIELLDELSAPAEEGPVVFEVPELPAALRSAPVEEPVAEAAPAPKKAAKKAPKSEPKKAPKKAPAPAPVVEEAPAPLTVHGFVLAEGERVYEDYQVVRGGHIVLTNRRMLFATSYRSELGIEHVHGVSSMRRSIISWGKLFFGVLLLAACVFSVLACTVPSISDIMLGLYGDIAWIQWVVLGVGCVLGIIGLSLLAKCSRRKFALNILTDDIQQLISFRSPIRRGEHDLYTTVVISSPGKDYKRFVAEVGAKIVEIKRDL